MHLLILTALLQTTPQLPTERQLLEAEHARHDSSGVLARAAASNDPRLQRLAIRALGRFERAEHVPTVTRQVTAADPTVRREAINALGQMRAPFDFATLLATERDATVRAAIYETLGRVAGSDSAVQSVLAAGFAEASATTRAGAARGLESYVRRHVRTQRPTAATIVAMRRAFAADTATETRQLLLLALTAAGDRDSLLLATALRDRNEQVRRLAVIGARQWVDDPSPMVRYQALRVAGTCERAVAALSDSSEHVALTAVDVLGERKCDVAVIEPVVRSGRTWRMQARALVSLARVAPASVASHLPRFRAHAQWQARAYAANAARIIGDSATLSMLARDNDPNVVSAALNSVADARRALASNHAGLLLDAVAWLQRAQATRSAIPELIAALQRTTATRNITYRDVRVAILDRLGEIPDDSSVVPFLRTLLDDIDPDVATRAARIVSARSGTTVAARTTVFRPAPLPSAAFMASLRGAHAIMQFRAYGPVRLELLPDDATVTVATFAQLADEKRFDGLTIHRIVPNFVIQGASPGANEYDGLTTHFMRDEVGFTRNARGTLGVSTRGRDTGDGQIFVNLVDNFRLDHDYTVFARVVDGLSIIDRIQEGDVIESVRIVRANAPSRP